MSDHHPAWQSKLHDKTGQDIYFWNFAVLMLFTVFEVGAVYTAISYNITIFVLISVGIVKFFGIAAFFMHLWNDEKELTFSFMFPFIFALILVVGVGLTSPDGVAGLPSWCSPNWVTSYTP